jgi:hypothetical protein
MICRTMQYMIWVGIYKIYKLKVDIDMDLAWKEHRIHMKSAQKFQSKKSLHKFYFFKKINI